MKRLVPILVVASAVAAAWLMFFRPSAGELILYGNVDQRQVELAFIDSERVAEVLVQEGDRVRPGQVLARLETRRLRDAIAVAEAGAAIAETALARLKNGTRPEDVDRARSAVAVAEADLDLAERDHRRLDALWKDTHKAVRRQEYDAAVSRLSAARARLAAERSALRLAEIGPRWEDIAEAEAALLERRRNLDQLRNRLDDAELRCPAESVVSRRLLEPGDMASPQRAVLSLAVLTPKWARVYAAEPALGRLRPGMRALVFSDGFPDDPVPGTVGFISSVAEFTPKTVETEELRASLVYEVRVIVEDAEDRLRLGMPVTVRLPDAPGGGADGR